MWLIMAVLSAFFAGLTSILAKCGIRKTDSDVATALRTVIVLLFSWIMVFVVQSAGTITEISFRSLLFLLLSGLATGASWICYFKALSMGDVNKVVPVDKSSTVLSVLMAIILFGETEHLELKLVSTAILAGGIFLMIERKPAAEKGNTGDHGGEGRDGDHGGEEDCDRDHGGGAEGCGKEAGGDSRWMIYAVLSAVFAALTSILAKVGITGVESNLGTAIRTGVVLVMAWVIVFMKGKQAQVRAIDKRESAFICLSGLATGASWLCYYYAIQNGIVSVVVPIDKLSILVTVAFSWLVFKEKLGRRSSAGLLMMVAGTLAMAIGA